MGFTSGWTVLERVDASLRKQVAAGDQSRARKGKQKQTDEVVDTRELDVTDRRRAIMFNVGELEDGFEKIVQRIRSEQPTPISEFLPFSFASGPVDLQVCTALRLILDINSLAFGAYKSATRVIDAKRSLSPNERKICYERLQLWITRSISQEYAKAVPSDCEVQIEVHVDHWDNREGDKEAELERRYLDEAVAFAEKALEVVSEMKSEETRRGKKKETRARKRKGRKVRQSEKKKEDDHARLEEGTGEEPEDGFDEDENKDEGEKQETSQWENKIAEALGKYSTFRHLG
jgi:hypothetical protein